MLTAALLIGTGARPSAVVGKLPTYQVSIGFPLERRRLNRAIVMSFSPASSFSPGSFTIGCPLWLTVDGQKFINPGLMPTFPEGTPVVVTRNGHLVVAAGFLDYPSVDLTAGWVILTCADITEDWNRTNHGVGTGGWVAPPGTDTGIDPTVPATNWVGANATLSSVDTPWGTGTGISVAHGNDRTNPWHFGAVPFTVEEDEQLALSAIVNLSAGASSQGVMTMRKWYLDDPKNVIDVPVAVPPGISAGTWCASFPLPSVQGESGRTIHVDVAGWSPVMFTESELGGLGHDTIVIGGSLNGLANQFAVRSSLTATAAAATTQVPVGGDSVDMCVQLANESFARAGGGGSAVKRSDGMPFTDDMSIADTNTGTYSSLMSEWSSTSEWRRLWDEGTVEFGGPGDLGQTWDQIRVTASAGARARATILTGVSKGQARYTTAIDPTTGWQFTAVTDTVPRGWDKVVQVPDGADFVAYAGLTAAQAAVLGRPITVTLGPPPGGSSPGDWLDLGMLPGDRVPTAVEAGPWSQLLLLRITNLVVAAVTNEFVTLTLEAIQ